MSIYILLIDSFCPSIVVIMSVLSLALLVFPLSLSHSLMVSDLSLALFLYSLSLSHVVGHSSLFLSRIDGISCLSLSHH